MASTVDAKRVAEHFDSAAALDNKLDTLAQYVRESRHTVFFTGAGVSTSAGIPDYRGPSGAWTERRIRQLQATASRSQAEAAELAKLLQERRQESEKAATKVPMTDAEPTYCHMAMAKMISAGQAGFVVTTNLDGIFRKAGLRGHKELCCLHGDVYVERCTGCGHDFERNYHVRDARIHVHDHAVGACTRCGSRTPTSYTGRPREGAPRLRCRRRGRRGRGAVRTAPDLYTEHSRGRSHPSPSPARGGASLTLVCVSCSGAERRTRTSTTSVSPRHVPPRTHWQPTGVCRQKAAHENTKYTRSH